MTYRSHQASSCSQTSAQHIEVLFQGQQTVKQTLSLLQNLTEPLPWLQIKQMEAVQRVLELEAAVDQLRLEKTDLSYRLKQELQRNGRAPDAGGGGGGPAASDTGSEVRSLRVRTRVRVVISFILTLKRSINLHVGCLAGFIRCSPFSIEPHATAASQPV